MNICIKRTITQVRHGEEYTVRMEFLDSDGIAIEFQVKFTIPIWDFDEKVNPSGIDECRQIIVITAKSVDEQDVAISDEVFASLVDMVAVPAMEAYNHPMMKGSNEGELGEMLAGTHANNRTVGMTVAASFSCDLTYPSLPLTMMDFIATTGVELRP